LTGCGIIPEMFFGAALGVSEDEDDGIDVSGVRAGG
jgi:hypothetical protein